MSLADAVLDIAQEMEKAADEGEQMLDLHAALCTYASQLRLVVKAAGGPPTLTVPPGFTMGADGKVHLANRDLRKPEPKDDSKGIGKGMVEIADGPMSDDVSTLMEIDPSMPVGAKMFIGSYVYQLGGDGKLHYASSPPSLEGAK